MHSVSLITRKFFFIVRSGSRKSSSSVDICKMSISQSTKKPFTIFVEGNIGSGKTTFINFFRDNPNILTLSEPVPEWKNLNGHNLLKLMYKDIGKWSFIFQSYVQLTMTMLHEMKTNKPVKMMERSLYSARYCFVENLCKSGTLPPPQVAVLDSWFEWLISRCDIPCDLIVYLRTSPKVAYERIRSRNREEELGIDEDYIRRLHNSYENWLYFKNKFTCPARVLVLDANKDLESIQDEFTACQNEIRCFVKNMSAFL